MSEYIILKKVVCRNCGGCGYTQHPAWAQYWEENRGSMPDIVLWFRKNGWEEPPPEEITCDECEGTGYVLEKISLEQFLSEIREVV